MQETNCRPPQAEARVSPLPGFSHPLFDLPSFAAVRPKPCLLLLDDAGVERLADGAFSRPVQWLTVYKGVGESVGGTLAKGLDGAAIKVPLRAQLGKATVCGVVARPTRARHRNREGRGREASLGRLRSSGSEHQPQQRAQHRPRCARTQRAKGCTGRGLGPTLAALG